MRIAFIGLGVMGVPMARNLMAGGHTLQLYTRRKEKAEGLIAAGAAWSDTLARCVAGCEAVVTMVGFPSDVESVYFGEDGILENAAAGTLLIDCTTTSPALSARIYEAAKAKGLQALDAPVSGGDIGAQKAALSIMAGGDRDAFEKGLPIFRCIGKSATYAGKAGNGQHMKMANQVAIAGAVAGVAEAVAYGRGMGLDLQAMLDCISQGAAGSWQMSNNGYKMVRDDMAPGFFVKHYIKDMRIAGEESGQRGLDLPVLKQVLSQFEALAAQGMGDLGTQAVIRYYEKETPQADAQESS